MANLKTSLIRAGLDTLYFSKAYRIIGNQWAGAGLIFMLHHVRPEKAGGSPEFHPNRILEITPEFLDAALRYVRLSGLDLVSLDEAVDRLARGDVQKRFACFTIDDGYRDNLEFALPVFRKHECPFTVFVATGIIDCTTELWWLALEDVVRNSDTVNVRINGEHCSFETRTLEQMEFAYREVYWALRRMPESEQRGFIRDLAGRYNFDLVASCRREAMTWDEVRTLASEPLVTIGAHTVDHFAIGKLDAELALQEMTASRRKIERETGRTPEHFCFPYGDPGSAGKRDFALAAEAGFRSAVTTRKGVLFEDHAHHLHALPRVSLNGDYQDLKYVELFLSGAPFALLNRFQRVAAA